MIGAVLMAVVADWSAAHTSGPPRLVTFSPTFILLIPGALAITGLTQIFGPERALAFTDLYPGDVHHRRDRRRSHDRPRAYEAGARLAHGARA